MIIILHTKRAMHYNRHTSILLFHFLITVFHSFCVPLSVSYPSQKILLVHSDFSDDVETALKQTGQFAEVATFHAEQATPALELLASYDAVLVWSMAKFSDPAALGDVLADYWDGGGRVVLAQYSMTNSSLMDMGGSLTQVLGRFGSRETGYVFLDPVGREYDCCKDDLSISASVKTSPLLAGVDVVGVPSIVVKMAPIHGGEVVASWSNGYPLLVRGTRGGRCLIAINAVPRSIIGRELYDRVTLCFAFRPNHPCLDCGKLNLTLLALSSRMKQSRRPFSQAGCGCCRTRCWRARGPRGTRPPRSRLRPRCRLFWRWWLKRLEQMCQTAVNSLMSGMLRLRPSQ